MVAGEQVQWSLFHRGRGGTNSFRFNIGTNPTGSGSTRMFDGRTTTGGSGAILATGLGTSAVQSQASATWARYSGSFTWNSSGLTGSNFIMKLDERTLPIGYRVTSENPRVIRLTAGKTSALNFGAARVRQVRLDLQDAAFLSGSPELRTEWAQGIDQLITLLAAEESILLLSYDATGTEPGMAGDRLQALNDLVQTRWQQVGNQYRLEIETRVEVRP